MRALDLTGQRFGKLTVLRLDSDRTEVRRFICRCECGAETSVTAARLAKETRSCGCLAGRPSGKAQDMTGLVFGRWTVTGRAPAREESRHLLRWSCRCECGNTSDVLTGELRDGSSQSCGCLRVDVSRARLTTHGFAPKGKKMPEYSSWLGVMGRVTGAGPKSKKNYVERGIYACPRWLSFPAFFEDMGLKPTAKHEIDRIDNDRSYTCGKCDDCIARGATANCRWATRTENMRNTRRNRLIAYNGETLTMTEWSERLMVPAHVLRNRIDRGWDIDRVITEPTQVHQKQVRVSMRFNLAVTS